MAEYHLNGNATDVSGNGNHGTASGVTTTTGRSGAPNSAFYFDADTDLISLPTALVSGTAGTYSFWFKSDETFTGHPDESSFTPFFVRQQTGNPVAPMQFVISIGTSTSAVAGEILTIGGKTSTVADFRSAVAASSFGEINTEWHHIALTTDSTGHRLYFDGSLQDLSIFSGAVDENHNLLPFTAAEFVQLDWII